MIDVDIIKLCKLRTGFCCHIIYPDIPAFIFVDITYIVNFIFHPWYTEFEFEVAEEQGMTAEDAFNSFAEFIDENRNKLDKDLKDVCMILADKLADSYHHTNKKEKHIIQRLKETLYSLQPIH